LYRKGIAEFIGTFTLVFAGCGAMMVSERFPGVMFPGAVSLVFGLVVLAMVYAVGHLSGAHLNPAVTLAFSVARHFPKSTIPIYLASQCAGAIAAMTVLNLILPPGTETGATLPHVGVWQAFGWEVILTFFVMFVVMSVATDTRAVGTMAGIAVGAVVTIAAFVGGPITGASMNPARSLGPALVSGNLQHLWIYLAAPVVGAVSAALVYNWIRHEVPA
jgi:aquaporin NIP